MWCLLSHGQILIPSPHFNFHFLSSKWNCTVKPQFITIKLPMKREINAFFFFISNPGKGVSSDGRLLISLFHRVKHLPPKCPTLMNTFLHLQPTRPCLIFRECRSLAIMPQGWVAPGPSDVAAGKTLSLSVSASYLPLLPSEEGVSLPALCSN